MGDDFTLRRRWRTQTASAPSRERAARTAWRGVSSTSAHTSHRSCEPPPPPPPPPHLLHLSQALSPPTNHATNAWKSSSTLVYPGTIRSNSQSKTPLSRLMSDLTSNVYRSTLRSNSHKCTRTIGRPPAARGTARVSSPPRRSRISDTEAGAGRRCFSCTSCGIERKWSG